MNELDQYQLLGVINRTPNSFSDSGLSLKSDFFKDQLTSFLKHQELIVDFGFESTAPTNKAISDDEEWERFSLFLDEIKGLDFGSRIISFDTYKALNFFRMKKVFLEIHPNVNFLFNDVSGVLDDSLNDLLLKTKDEKIFYVYTFTHIPERSLVLDHMKYINEKEDIINQCLQSFIKAYKFFKSHNKETNLILDPGFGFSKTYEQNWRLIDSFEELSKGLVLHDISCPILIGLSKKSFLKKYLNSTDLKALENLHLECLLKMSQKSSHKLLFRVHDPGIFP